MAEVNPEVKVTLSAEDAGLSSALKQLSDELKRLDSQQKQTASVSSDVSKKIASNYTSIGKAAREMADSIKLRLANIPGLGGFGSSAMIRAYEPIGKLAEQAGTDLEDKLGPAAGLVGGLAAALVTLGVVAVTATRHMIELAQSVENASAATGLSTRQVQELTEIAKEMDVDASGLQMAFARVQSQLGEFVATGKAAGSGSQYFVRILREMNISLTDVQGRLRPTNDILADFYDQVSKIGNQSERSALEMAAFGTRGRVIAQVFEEARREGMSYRDMLASIDASGNVIPDSQLEDLMEAKRRWDELTRSVRGFMTQLELLTAETVVHPGSFLKGLVEQISGANPAGIATEMALASSKGADATAGAGAANALRLGQALQLNEQLSQRVALLRAGGEAQLQLLTAETGYATAVKAGDRTLADAYRVQIADLRQIIALEAERKKPKKTIEQQEAEENARAARQFAEIIKGVERTKKEALHKQQEAVAQELRQENEDNQRAARQFADIIKNMERAKQEELKRVQQENARINDELNGDKSSSTQLRLSEAEAQMTKANATGQKQLAAAYAQQIIELKQLIATQQQMITSDQVLHTLSSSMKTAMNDLFQSIGRGAHSVEQAFGQMELAVIHSLENIATEMVANLAIALMTDNMQKISAAKRAAANTYASVSAIPVVGWILAPPAAAAAFAAAMAYRAGGLVQGPGGPTSDRVPAMLSNGEFVMRADAVSSIGLPRLQAMNAGDIEPSGVHVHVHPQITNNLFHNGKDAQTVLEEQLVPAIQSAVRAGSLRLNP